MATAIADLFALLKDIPSGTWVAISEEQNIVLSFGADAQADLHEARDKGEKQPLMMRVPDGQAAMFL